MELTFVNQYAGDPPKRRRLAKACESCRARKKRCKHYLGVDIGSDTRDESSVATAYLTPGGRSNGGHDTSGRGSSADEDEHSRGDSNRRRLINETLHFVGDSTPESTLLKRPVPSDNDTRRIGSEDVGIWVDRREWEALVQRKNEPGRAVETTAQANTDGKPHSTVLAPLLDIFFQKIHPILPLLDEREFRRNHARAMVPEPLVHAMCLVAAKDSEAEPHLRLTDSSAPVSARRFCSGLHASITSALKAPRRFEKITLIRILALTSLHNEGSDGAEEASIHLSKAMHYAQTIGIHLGQQAAVPGANELGMKRLFWCLYALDRASSAMNGRPIIMSDADMACESFAPGESGFPAFEVWLRVSELLNKVINFYRPTSDLTSTGWEEAYPGLEEILDDVSAWSLSPSLLATIHLFYLSVAILSHRTRGVRTVPRALPSQIRQRLCALEVIRLLSNPSTAHILHPLPIIPYAVSLSLSVAYQHLRQSQLAHQQNDALQDFRTCCTILQDLRRTWGSADVMAALAKKVLGELDRTPDLAVFRVRRAKQDPVVSEENGATAVAIAGQADVIPPPTACHHGLGSLEAGAGLEGAERLPGAAAVPTTVPGDQEAALQGPIEDFGPDGLFENIDDVFGTFLDPNYPLSLEDVSFVEDLAWQGVDGIGGG